jgi:hypothetical protein
VQWDGGLGCGGGDGGGDGGVGQAADSVGSASAGVSGSESVAVRGPAGAWASSDSLLPECASPLPGPRLPVWLLVGALLGLGFVSAASRVTAFSALAVSGLLLVGSVTGFAVCWLFSVWAVLCGCFGSSPSLRSGRKSAGVSVFLGLVGSSVLAASVCSGSCWVGFIVAFCACCLLVGAPPSFHTDEASTAETALALPGCLWCCWVLGAVVQWVRLQWGWPSAVSLGARAWWWAYPASWSGRGSSGGRVLRWARAGAVGGAAADRLSSFRLGVRPSTRWASACCRPRLASHSSLPDQPRCLHLVSGLQ